MIFPRGTIFDEHGDLYDGVVELLKVCKERGYDFLFTTHNIGKAQEYSHRLKEATGLEKNFYSRKKIREILSNPQKTKLLKTTIIVGSSDTDLYLAANNKLLLINPSWSYIQEEKAKKYGFSLDTPSTLIKMLKIIENQNSWYYELDLDDKSTVYALTAANNKDAQENESVMINRFRNLLKSGDRTYFEALFFHLISGIMKSDELRQISIWGIMPSSGLALNEDMLEIKERCRYLTNVKNKNPLLTRHTAVEKSRTTEHGRRLEIGAKKHLDSIKLNPVYKGKLEGKTVCILDDYLTNGSSFEAVRNLLMKAGAEKVYFVAFGRFKRGLLGIYQKENYYIERDVYSDNYVALLSSKDSEFGCNGVYNEDARTEVDNIYKILNE
ncbi:hypothetical protein RV14_GL000922 [Enterococcus ratti]|uniref:Phosphoribosyltransferase domain-containing protein n=1 Tax=Enterococcus ratti TaxID=150033 RepID=A0A1L8WRP5_9ENTE|nr:hypothetical protein RV14_GL000922 [Enterococcus ratti]